MMRAKRENNQTHLAFTSDAARLVTGDIDSELHI
jgi:hypothetical protein